MRRHPTAAAALAVLLATITAGCADDDGEAVNPRTAEPAPAAPTSAPPSPAPTSHAPSPSGTPTAAP